ncbi:cytochrome c maturation protein CcmE [soil metagenome]
MNVKHKQRAVLLSLMVLGISLAVGLVLYALQQNINLFFTPEQITAGKAPKEQLIRLGGMVQNGSVKRVARSLTTIFVLTDKLHNVKVVYTGMLPDLFREGQGIVTQGKLNAQGVFVASEVLAKHSSEYMPAGAKYAKSEAK